ncbi:MAG: hypothetical protein JXR53_14635, partial [Bacteroidales bacterium]|nr:hypothetical protein [Bacteroidales bacterium]
MRLTFLLLLSLFIVQGSYADKYYWVNDGGDWSDTSHWATSSGGSTHYAVLPGMNDTVYFDANSFSVSGELINVDTNKIYCKMMDWTGIIPDSTVEFLSSSNDTLYMYGSLLLSDDVTFNFKGKIHFMGSLPTITEIDFKGKSLQCNIELAADTMFLSSALRLPQKYLLHTDGKFSTNNYNVSCRHFNVDTTWQNTAPIVSPQWFGSDTLTVNGSMAIGMGMLFAQSGPVYLNFSTLDSNYFNAYNNAFNTDFHFKGSKKMYLLSNLQTNGDVIFESGCTFKSNDNDITVNALKITSSLNKSIDLGTSLINITGSGIALSIVDAQTQLNSVNSDLLFSYSGSDTVQIYVGRDSLYHFNSVELPVTVSKVYSSFSTDTLKIAAASEVYLAHGIEITVYTIDAAGDCGHYIFIRSFCMEAVVDNPAIDCPSNTPVFTSTGANITLDYVKITDNEAQGATFTANNSFDQEYLTGWTINEPTDTRTLYWVGGSGDWDDFTHWSENSGDVSYGCIPVRGNSVVFDAASFSSDDTVNIVDIGYCANMSWPNIDQIGTLSGMGSVIVTDTLLLHDSTMVNLDNGLHLINNDAATYSITSRHADIYSDIYINGTSNRVLSDTLYTNGTIHHIKGGFNLNRLGVFASAINTSGLETRDLNYKNSVITLFGEDTVWNSAGSNLTINHDSATVILANSSSSYSLMNAAGRSFDTIKVVNESSRIAGGGSSALLALMPGISIEFEPNSTWTSDSITAAATCSNPIYFGAYKNGTDTATFIKGGYDTLYVSDFIIQNLVTDTTGLKYCEAAGSTSLGNTNGWTFSASPTGKTYYWSGLVNQNWSNVGNWEQNLLPASCLPGPMDTVIFDQAHLNLALSDSVMVDKNSFCRVMDWSGAMTSGPSLVFKSNLQIYDDVILNDSLSLVYSAEFSAYDENSPSLILSPFSQQANFMPLSKKYDINTFVAAASIADTLFLMDSLVMDSIATLGFISGAFDAGENSIYCGILKSLQNSDKILNLNKTYLEVKYRVDFQDNSILSLSADSSLLIMPGNQSFKSAFYGGGQDYFNVHLAVLYTDSADLFYTSEITGSNHFNILATEPGMYMSFEDGSIQTFDSLFYAIGTCQDSIYLHSSNSGVQATLTKLSADSIRPQCVVVEDLIATNGASPVFSRSEGNNTGWYFDPTPATTANFSLPALTCYGDSIHFTNTSEAYSGNFLDMNFDWEFGDDSTSVLTDPTHFYSNNRQYVVTLTSTYINGCSDTFIDTIQIHKPFVNLSCSEADTAICFGDQITFSSSTSNPDTSFAYYVNGALIPLGTTEYQYPTDSLSNGDIVYVVQTYEGCIDTSNQFTVEVFALPTPTLSSSDFDMMICDGDSVTLTAAMADRYKLFLNGVEYAPIDTTDEWTLNTLIDGDEFTLYGINDVTGCENMSTDTLTFIVDPLPVVLLTSSDADTTICNGDTVTVYASGANEYLFYLNSVPIGVESTVDTLNIVGLTNNDIITVEGISSAGCRDFSSGYLEFTVNPRPILSFISDDFDNIVCSGEDIAFQAGGADEYLFYLDGAPQGGFGFGNSLNQTFTSSQDVSVEGKLGDCYAFADTVFHIDVRPTITWTYSADEICSSDTITLESHGDSIYQYLIDGSAVTPVQNDSVYQAFGLADGQVITVQGTAGACTPTALTVMVHPNPTVSVSCSDPDTAICNGDNIIFTASGSDQYAFFVDGVQDGAYSTVAIYNTSTLTDGQEITVQANTGFGCHSIAVDSFTVQVAPYPTVSMMQDDPDLTICDGDTVIFTAGGADYYEFYVAGNSQGYGASNTLVFDQLANGNQVVVEGTTGYCTATSLNVYTYTVNGIPNISFSPSTPLSTCSGDTIKLLAGGASTYQFYIDGVPAGPLSGNNLFSTDTLQNGETVSVEGYMNGCLGFADTAYSVIVNDYPVLLFTNNQPTGSICFGDTVNFLGNGAQNYSFYLDGIPVSNDSVWSITNLQDNQSVTLWGINGVCGLWADSVYTLDVNYVDISLDLSPSTAFCNGSQITFSANGADLYEFYVDGISQGSPSATNIYQNSSLTNGQIVSVAGSSTSNGCTQLALADYYIHIFDIPTISVSPSATFCEGDSAELSSSNSIGNQWFDDAGMIAGATLPDLWVYESGNYYVSSAYGGNQNVLSCGNNGYGQFGDGSTANSLYLTAADLSSTMVQVACGAEFTLALSETGEIHAWGHNEFGALGSGNFTNYNTPIQSGSINNAVQISAGERFSVALLEDSTLMSWGENTYGQLGYGNLSTSNFPFAVIGLDSVVDIAAGANHCLALTSDGTVWAWGRNQSGQLGDSTLIQKTSPVQVKNLNNIVKVGAGGNHSLALANDGTLYAWGNNSSGQLGIGNYNASSIPQEVKLFSKIASFDAGHAHTIACDSSGYVLCWGDNAFGQLGVQSISESLYPITVDSTGYAIDVVAGQYSSYALRNDSNLVAWGFNTSGQLGIETNANTDKATIVDQAFEVLSFDAGNDHMAIIPSASHSCSSNNQVIAVDTIPDIDIIANGYVLSTTTVGVSYQWYYNGSPIPGATNNNITVSAWGNYYVEVTFANGCSGNSPIYTLGVGVDEYDLDEVIVLYPNPNNGTFSFGIQ